MKKYRLLFVLALGWLGASGALAQTPAEAIHNELRALRDGLMDAINKGDLERELSFLHTNVVITWHNAEVSRGREGVRAYYDRLTSGPEKMVEKFSAEITVDDLTVLYGDDTGVSFGSSIEHFKLTNGRDFELKGRWTATLVKENGRWLVASLHVSTNLFDNALLNLTRKWAYRIAAITLVAGGLLGWFIGRGRKPAT